jgi:hypothetical protein
MQPLASSNTQPGDPKKTAQNPKGTTQSGDKTDEGGRTAKPDDQKEDKTLENENSK